MRTAKDDAIENLKPQDRPIQLAGMLPSFDWVPSRFNARADAPDGTLVLYNSFTGAYSGFPRGAHEQVEECLHRAGYRGPETGMTKYLFERGFLVKKGTSEIDRFRYFYGASQYRQDVLELILLSSEECNFRCVYCYETFPRGTMEPWVRQAIRTMVERRAPILNKLNVSYFGGEPLLGWEAIEELGPFFHDLSEKHDIRYGSGMTTNAYLLTPDRFDKCLKWRITTFQITVDGVPENHDAHRPLKGGGSTFAQIYSNLSEMQRFPGDFRVAIRVNFDKTNVPRMDEFLGIMSRFKDDPRYKFRFYPVGKWGGPNDEGLDVCGLDAEGERQKLDVRAADLGYNAESRMPYLTRGNVCYAARPYNLLIGADGKIMKCTVALDTQDYNIVGHMTPDGRADIDIDKMAKWITPYFEDDAMCKSCFFVPVCQGCSCPLPRFTSGERPCPPEKLEIRNTLVSIWNAKHPSGHRYNLTKEAIEAEEPEPALVG